MVSEAAASPTADQPKTAQSAVNPDPAVTKVPAAEAGKTAAAQPLPKAPVTITADELYMNDSTGDVYAKGNVKMLQGDQQIMTDLLNGNTQQQELWVPGQADYVNSVTKAHLDGGDTRYNYQTKEGTMATVKGRIDRDFVSGQSMVMESTDYIIHDGTITRCPAKVPDYHISAERIVIYPGQKMVAYNAKVWIKNVVIYSLPVYEQSLESGAASEAYPSVGFGSKNGMHLRQKVQTPVGKNLSAFVNLDLYMRGGFKPDGGITYKQHDYSLALVDGYYRDDDDNWIKKQPELDFKFFSHPLGSLPFHYSLNAQYGRWMEDGVSSWHQEYNVYVSRDTIHLNDKTTLDMGTGTGYTHESYDNSHIVNFRLDTAVKHTFDDRWIGWVGYHYNNARNGLFAYGRPDMARELETGFRYKIDDKNAVKFNQTYDLHDERVFDQDITWSHDIHCWTSDITYRAKRNEWRWDFTVKKW